MRVVGSAVTGKTIVALHRVVRILRADPAARVSLTTFSEPLAAVLKRKLNVLVADDPRLTERVVVSSFEQAARGLYALMTGRKAYLVNRDKLRDTLGDTAQLPALDTTRSVSCCLNGST